MVDKAQDATVAHFAASHSETDLTERFRTTRLPLSVALEQLIRSEIVSGRWPPGTRLPTIAALATKFGLARVTVREALGRLVRDGSLRAVQGKGTFVSKTHPKPRIVHVHSSWKHFLQSMDSIPSEPISIETGVDLPAAFAEDGTSMAPYRRIRRAHRRDGEPYCCVDLYLAEEIYRRDPTAFDSELAIPVLSRLLEGQIENVNQLFWVSRAGLSSAHLLGVELGAAIGCVSRCITNVDGKIVYAGLGEFRADTVVFNVDIDVPGAAPAAG